MKLHGSARTCPNSRRLLAHRVLVEGWSLTAAARAAGVSDRTARKWVGRFRREGERGLLDRSSAPRRIPHKVPAQRVAAIEALRRLRLTAAEIAELLGMALSTVSLWLKRIGLGRRSRLAPPEPPNRYERTRPGELVHVDVKKLGRHVREAGGLGIERPEIDDHRLARCDRPAASLVADRGLSAVGDDQVLRERAALCDRGPDRRHG